MNDTMSTKKASKNCLRLIFTEDSFRVDPWCTDLSADDQRLKEQIEEDPDRALFTMGFEAGQETEDPSVRFLRKLSRAYVDALMDIPGLELEREHAEAALSDVVEETILQSVPFALGAEYINKNWLLVIVQRLNCIYQSDIRNYDGTVESYLAEKSQSLHVPERVFFHLVENREDTSPFAFMATYASLDENGGVKHYPLSYALTEYKTDRDKLITLLSCLNQAAEHSPLIREFMNSGELFHPLRFSSEEAYEFLMMVPEFEKCHIICRIPNWWRRKSSMVSLQVKLGEDKPAMLGFDSIVSMTPELVVNGEALTPQEIEQLLHETEGLAYLKGKWIQVNHAELQDMLEALEKYNGNLSLLDALRMETGVSDKQIDIGPIITNGTWLSSLMEQLKNPAKLRQLKAPASIHAVLRPYQIIGYNWLMYMMQLGFGACLADDMGLGKTLQVLTFLDKLRTKQRCAKVLLVVPASLLGNWEKETQRFAPKISYQILHSSVNADREHAVGKQMSKETEYPYLTITTYGMIARKPELQDVTWDYLILDEAQAIKNPGTKQTKAVKKLKTYHRIALTGTPIENDLTNLWSLFDFLNKGLLGSSEEFRTYVKRLNENPEGYQKLKDMIAPFILRRLKTDKAIISDLPEKWEQNDYVFLSKKQVVLYRKQVAELSRRLSDVSGMERRGLVLATITKLKQICNHPDQYMGQETYLPKESGKFEMLGDICLTVCEKRERVLVFTQYKEIADYLARYLEGIFGMPGFVLHGGTRVKKRTEMVDRFNSDEYIPFMVISVKAGGTGLNLTAANHVIHFDRWWNPAVENQATDRAFRIGQKKNVIVHKLVSKGTIEEKIDAIINDKKALAEQVIGSGGESWITEMSDEALLQMMRLEI